MAFDLCLWRCRLHAGAAVSLRRAMRALWLRLFACGRAWSRFRSDMSFFVRAFFALAVCGVPAVSTHTRVDVHLEAAPRGALRSGGAGVAGVSSVGWGIRPC